MAKHSARLDRLKDALRARLPCTGCGLALEERRPILGAYEDAPAEGEFDRCPVCGRPTRILIRVVYDEPLAAGAYDG